MGIYDRQFLPLKINKEFVYAGFKKRFLAGVVDLIIVFIFSLGFSFLVGLSIQMPLLAVPLLLLNSLFYSIYQIYFHAQYGATVGKLLMRIRVTQPDGSKIILKEAVKRSVIDLIIATLTFVALIIGLFELIELLSLYPEEAAQLGWMEKYNELFVQTPIWHSYLETAGFLWIVSELIVLLFNERRRAIHDFIAGTVVINYKFSQEFKETGFSGF